MFWLFLKLAHNIVVIVFQLYEYVGSPAVYSGTWKWSNLRSQKLLIDHNTPSGRWVKNWDAISQTPWLYNPSTRMMISYDDPQSIGVKVDYAKCKGIKGVGVWDLTNDYFSNQSTSNGELMTQVTNVQMGDTGNCNVSRYPQSQVVGSGPNQSGFGKGKNAVLYASLGLYAQLFTIIAIARAGYQLIKIF
jgi:hypothetical protein